jgi:glycosyltransferase involved in cell wall biosynthesis/tetratricopeptide (TPR) repeat protein
MKEDMTRTLERHIDITDPPVMGRRHIAKPLVTIILPTFSRGRTGTLHMAIESVLAQSFGELELIVVDDGSTDGTADVIQRYAARDNRVVHVRYEKNCGFPAPRMNAGMVIARGKYIGFVFDDGCLYQQAVEKLYSACRQHPNTVCYGLCNEYRGNNAMTWGFDFSEELLRHKNLIPNNAVLFPREIAEKCGGYDHNVLLTRVNDWDLWRRYSRHAEFHRVSDIVAEEHGPNQPDSLENAFTMHHDMGTRLIQVDRGEKLMLSQLSRRNAYGLEDFGENLTAEDLLRAFELFAEHARHVGDEEAVEFFETRCENVVTLMESGRSVASLPLSTLRVCHLRAGSEEELRGGNRAEEVLAELVTAGELERRRVAQKGANYFVAAADWLSFDVCVFDWPLDQMGLALMEGLRRFGAPAALNVEDVGELVPETAELLADAIRNSAVTIVPDRHTEENLKASFGAGAIIVLPSERSGWLAALQSCVEKHSRRRNPVRFSGGSRGAVGPNRYAVKEQDVVRMGDFVHLQAREFNALNDHRSELGALNTVLNLNPGHVPAALDRAGLLRKVKKYGLALERLEPTLALHPGNHELAARAMELALEVGDRGRAAYIFKAYLEASLEAILNDGSESETASPETRRIVEGEDEQGGPAASELIGRVSALLDRGDMDKAREVVLSALYAHPTRVEPYLLYGDYHLRVKDFGSAARGYFAALSFDPHNDSAQAGLLEADRMRGRGDAPVQGEPEFSVLINTYNRAGWLRKCLAGYCVQTFSPERFEIVIVDDGSEDDTRAVVESFEPHLNIRYVGQEHAGMAIARTRLVNEAGSPLLGFFDDDDIVAPTCVEEHWKAHQKHPDPGVAVLGYTEWSPDLNVTPLMHYVTQVGRQYVDYPSLKHGEFYDFRCFWGGRSSCKKAVLDGGELFDPQFTFGYEDIELAYRLSKRRSFRVLYNENAVHRFMQPADLDGFLRRSERQGRTAHFFSQKHSDPVIEQYLPVADAVSGWANLEPIYDRLTGLARALERTCSENLPESLESDRCKELFLVYGKLHEGAWAKGVQAGRKEKLEPAIEKARADQRGPRILILDEILAVPDRTGGGLRMHRIVDLLLSLGCRVTYGAFLPHGYDAHSERLNRLGVRTVYLGGTCSRSAAAGREALARAHQAIDEIDGLRETYDIVWICFHWLARIYLPLIRLRFPEAKVCVDSVDLHYIREARAARIAGDRRRTMRAYATRIMELTTYACADGVGVVTDVEVQRLSLDLPQTPVSLLPLVQDPVPATPGRRGRRGLVFVGGFFHEPNVDAVLWFVKEIHPLITGRHSDADVCIVGQEPTDEIKDLAGPHIRILGWVPETAPYLNRALVSIAPLRYGSGMKGKISEALAYGVPVVTTSVGAEGIGIVNGVHALVADTPTEFADAVCRLMEDGALWDRLSTAGKRLLEERWGSARMRKRLETLLSELLKGATRVRATAAAHSGPEGEQPLQDPEQSPTYAEALEATESGDLSVAIRLLTMHLNERPDHAGGWSDLGVLHYQDGRLAEACECFERALATPGGWQTLACENFVECLLASGEREQAHTLACYWLEEAPEMPEPWLLRARLSFEEDGLDEARDAAQRALSIDPANETAKAYLAQIDDAEKALNASTEGSGTASIGIEAQVNRNAALARETAEGV